MPLQQYLIDSAGRFGSHTAIVTRRARHSYADLDRKSDLFAAALIERGLKKGNCVVIFMDDCYEAVVSIFAVLKAGGVLALINPAMRVEQLAHVLDESRAIAIITDPRQASVTAAAMERSPSVKLVVLARGIGRSRSRTCLCFEDAVSGIGPVPTLGIPTDDDDVALVAYPSVAGLVERGAMTHREVVAAVAAGGEPVGHGAGDVVMVIRRLWFAPGFCRLMAVIKAGATAAVERADGFVHAAAGEPECGLRLQASDV